ncbi:MAG: isoprenyl transferase [Clostridia bacterium]
MIFGKKNKDVDKIDNDLGIDHVAVIMDGNGRWAKNRGLPRSVGHKVGAENFKNISLYAAKIGLKHFTVYAFSTENWSRPKEEIGALMILFKKYLEDALTEFANENIRVNFMGDMTVFSKELQALIKRVSEGSKDRTGMVLNLAMNYGGRAEILYAIKEIEKRKQNGEDIDFTETSISDCLYTSGQPDPDLIIRPSGEQRLSNFLLWQCAYSEFVYSDVLWPDFKNEDLDRAIELYKGRNRRFGKV